MNGRNVDSTLWEGMAIGVGRVLASGPEAMSVRSAGSSLAFSGAPVADLNMAFAWDDAISLDALSDRSEDFVLVASPRGNSAVAARAEALSVIAVGEPLPVWLGTIDDTRLPPSRGFSRKADRSDMPAVHAVLAEAFGLDVGSLARAFPETLADTIDVYLAERDGCGVATVMAARIGTLVSLWSGGTIPEAREQGVFTDLLAHALRDQREQGAITFAGITEAVVSGRIVERLGGVHHTDGHVWIRGTSVGELLQG